VGERLTVSQFAHRLGERDPRIDTAGATLTPDLIGKLNHLRDELRSRNDRANQEDLGIRNMKRFTKILLIADMDQKDSVSLQRAVALARNNRASLTIVDFVEPIQVHSLKGRLADAARELFELTVGDKNARLGELRDSIAESGLDVVARVLTGKPFIETIRLVLEARHDLVIKTIETPPSLKKVFFGSTDMHLMRKCPCPVWLVKPTDEHRYKRILAAVDYSPEADEKDALNRQIIELSTSLALAESSELHVVHAWRLFAENYVKSARATIPEAEFNAAIENETNERTEWLKRVVYEYAAETGEKAIDCINPHLHVINGAADRVVASLAAELSANLIVMGTIARVGVPGFFIGNTAESILNQVECSVLTVKPPGYISPIAL